jgi:NAD(P)-dependent dehydrogenase (short-subunit alcohol dehydrogenase family)
MSDRLAGKVAIISGGTSGIGEATAERFAREGAQVVITGRSEDKGAAIASRLGDACTYVRADVLQEADIKATVDATIERHGKLDVLFNNAGAGVASTLTSVTEEQASHAMHLLFTSVILSMKHAIPHLVANGGGAIINNSSIAAIRDLQGDLLYSAAKVALTHYSKLAGVRLGPQGIRVNVISPGAIATPIFWGGSTRANTLTDEDNARKMDKLQRNLARANPMQRSGLADDIAEAATYLASDAGSFVNAHDLVVDGGRTSMFNEPASNG